MTRLLLALVAITTAYGCDDESLPAALVTDAEVESTDAAPGDDAAPDADLTDAAAQVDLALPPLDPLEPPELMLPPEAAPYDPQPASALSADGLPTLATLPDEASDRARFIENNLTRAGWLLEAFEPTTRPVEVAGWHDFLAGPSLAEFAPSMQAAYVDVLADAGLDTVVLPIGTVPWLIPDAPERDTALAAFDAVLERAGERDLAVHLHVAPTGHPQHAIADWAAYEAATLSLVTQLVPRMAGVVAEVRLSPPTRVRRTLPGEAEIPPEAWQALIDRVCAITAESGVRCAASVDAIEGWPYARAALASAADRLGIAAVGYTALHPETWIGADRLVDAFRRGSEAPIGAPDLVGRGIDGVFLVAERPTFPRTANRPGPSATAGLGCIEYNALDAAWLDGVFAYAQGRELGAITLGRTAPLLYLQGCAHTVRLYESVMGPGGVAWTDFQQGNPSTDPLYRAGVSIRLMAWDGALSVTGEALRKLAEAAD